MGPVAGGMQQCTKLAGGMQWYMKPASEESDGSRRCPGTSPRKHPPLQGARRSFIIFIFIFILRKVAEGEAAEHFGKPSHSYEP